MPERAANKNPSHSALPLFISGAPMFLVKEKIGISGPMATSQFGPLINAQGDLPSKHFGTAIDSSIGSAFIPYSKEKYSVLSK